VTKILKGMLPYGIVRAWQQKQERQRFVWMGVPADRVAALGVSRAAHLVAESRFDLWPKHLRAPPHDWALVDVGANEGQFLFAALEMVSPARVVTFEPQPPLAARLREAVRGRPGVTVVQAAVGAEPGEVALHVTDQTGCSSILDPKPDQFRKLYGGWAPAVVETVQVPQVTLDRELAAVERVGLLKLDVQGYELQVLRGAADVLRRTDAVLVEVNYFQFYDGATTFDDVHRLLSDAGFALTGVSPPVMNGEQVPTYADAVYTNVRRAPGPSGAVA
jgi:FkbM family methyltransferase